MEQRKDIETRFGGVRANPSGDQSRAGSQRAFYLWVETKATEKELQDYANDKSKPAVRRMFIKRIIGSKDVRDYFELTNQTHGRPQQTIQVNTPPTIQFVKEIEAEDVTNQKELEE